MRRFPRRIGGGRVTQERMFVSLLSAAVRRRTSRDGPGGSAAGLTLAAAVLGFFMVTLDAVVVNVALPTIRHDLGGGITSLQWIVDGYR
jgi:DHA2 family methylenomycin A resistance protein-like MFS transporter